MMKQTAQPQSSQSSTDTRVSWRSIGFWMAAALIAYTLFNVVRATLGPTNFAANFGIPPTGSGQDAFVYVYAIRSLFIGLFGLTLLIRRDSTALARYVWIGAVMPIGDALLVALSGGATGTVLRHALTAVFLIATGYFVWRDARNAKSGPA